MEGNAKPFNQKSRSKALQLFGFTALIKRLTALRLYGSTAGQTMVELLLALGIFAFIMTAVFALVFGGLTTGLRTEEQDYATMYAQEGLDAARSIRDTDWNVFVQNGTHGVANAGTGWSWSWTTFNEITYGARKFTREIFVEDVWRTDSNSDGIPDDIFTGSDSVNFDYTNNADYQCEGGACPSANLIVADGAAKLNGNVRLDNSVNPKELTSAETNLKALYHFNANEGKEINGPGDPVSAPTVIDDDPETANAKGLWHLNETSGTNTPDTSGNNNNGTVYSNLLYFHNTTDATAGLPAAEQSSDAANITWAGAGTIRQMTSTIGATQQAPSGNTNAVNGQLHFIRMWASPSLAAQTIQAQNWTFNFARRESSLAANFLTRAHLYVWRPSGSNCGATPAPCKVGTIISPITGANENTVVNTEQSYNWSSIAGSSVAVQGGDRLILEWWGQANTTTSGLNLITYYDGATVTTTNNTTVPSHASFLQASTGFILSNNSWTTAGKFSNALSFDGVDDYVSVANESNFDFERTQAFSAEAWVKTSSSSGEIVSKMNNSSPYIGYEFNVVTGGVLHVYLISDWVAVPAKALEVTGSVSINNNAWHHVALTYDGSSLASGLKLYVDGVLDPSITIVKDNLTAPNSILNNINLTIGSRNGQVAYFNGSIDETAVYSAALTPAQITDHYRRGVAEDATNPASAFEANDGNIYNATTTTGNTNLNQALFFDGTDDYVAIPSHSDLEAGANFSVEAWFKNSDSDTAVSRFIASKYNTGTNYWQLGKRIASNNDFGFKVSTGANSATAIVNGQQYNDNQWHHAVGVKSGTNLYLYIDGNQVAIGSNASLGSTSGAGYLFIGYSPPATAFWKDSIDEVAVWNKALTQIDIWDHIGANVGYQTNSYATVKYNINPSKDTSYIDKFKEFIEVATIPTGTSIDYQLSTDNCATMKYWDGDNWETSGGWNDIRTINRYINLLPPTPTTPQTICLSARLNTTDANQTPVLDNIEIKYSQNRDNAITWPADAHTKKVTSRVKWPSGFSFQDISLAEYLTDWMYPEFIDDTDADFTAAGSSCAGGICGMEAGVLNGAVYAPDLGATPAYYSSAPKDAGAPSNFLKVKWSASVPSGAILKFLLNSADTEAGLVSGNWCGPTQCLSYNTGYVLTDGNGEIVLNPANNNHQWFQYYIIIDEGTSDPATSPSLDKITIQAKNLY